MFQSHSQVISWHLLSLLFCFAYFESIKKKAGRKVGGLAGGGLLGGPDPDWDYQRPGQGRLRGRQGPDRGAAVM